MKLEGSCHCQAVRFSLESAQPYPFMRCYCSICRKTAGGGGYALKLPVIDISEVGAGGGSIAWLDKARSLKVGPESAGAVPGQRLLPHRHPDPALRPGRGERPVLGHRPVDRAVHVQVAHDDEHGAGGLGGLEQGGRDPQPGGIPESAGHTGRDAAG